MLVITKLFKKTKNGKDKLGGLNGTYFNKIIIIKKIFSEASR